MRARFLVTFCVLALLISACGSEGESEEPDTGSDNPPTTSTPNAADEDTTTDGQTGDEDSGAQDDTTGAQGLPPGGTGTVTLDGEKIEPAWVGSCLIDEQFDPQPGDLDVNVSLDGGLEALFLEVSMNETMGV
ncbi:MAG: hypothetical protein PVF87_11710, partial [Acidimicrobiia bacterium]